MINLSSSAENKEISERNFNWKIFLIQEYTIYVHTILYFTLTQTNK